MQSLGDKNEAALPYLDTDQTGAFGAGSEALDGDTLIDRQIKRRGLTIAV
jgi:predicted negative regulator of RcsB-dependent stress response